MRTQTPAIVPDELTDADRAMAARWIKIGASVIARRPSCPRPVEHKLHTVNLFESCPHCGQDEPQA